MNDGVFMPDVDVIIAVHQLNRPLKRAVQSALEAGDPGQVGVIVVSHGLDANDVRALMAGCPANHVQVVQHIDGIRSAAGPFNAGLRLAASEFVSVMGSDDMLEPGSLAAWVAQARRYSVDAVMAPLRFQSGAAVRTPRLRPIRRTLLDPVRDRLAYRTAPLGLIRRSTAQRMQLEFTEGLATGEDVSFSLNLWFGGTRVAMGRPGYHYIIGEDAEERVTQRLLPLDDEFAGFLRVLNEPWISDLPLRERRSIALKIARIHVLPAIMRRGAAWAWDGPDGKAVKILLSRLATSAPRYDRPLSRAERRFIAALDRDPVESADFSNALDRFEKSSNNERLLTEHVLENLLVESTIRYYLDLKMARALDRWIPHLAA